MGSVVQVGFESMGIYPCTFPLQLLSSCVVGSMYPHTPDTVTIYLGLGWYGPMPQPLNPGWTFLGLPGPHLELGVGPLACFQASLLQ